MAEPPTGAPLHCEVAGLQRRRLRRGRATTDPSRSEDHELVSVDHNQAPAVFDSTKGFMDRLKVDRPTHLGASAPRRPDQAPWRI
jgi:hypothetical protein